MKCNYHAHTPRCHHATGAEIEYVRAAVDGGFDVMGFSDHTPWDGDRYTLHMRMQADELDDYVAAVRDAGRQYEGKITVLCGVEAEYHKGGLSWLLEQKERLGLDYLLLGNHFVGEPDNGMWYAGRCETHAEERAYVDATIAGMQTGAYLYLAHPDLFLAQVTDFDDYARDCCRDLIRAAKDMGMPVEYNLEGLKVTTTTDRFRGQGYPALRFWEVAAEENAPCVIGVDAHLPESLTRTDFYTGAQETLAKLGMRPIERLL